MLNPHEHDLRPGASRMARRIVENLRAYAEDPHQEFAPCWACSPQPSHILAPRCLDCVADVAAERERLGPPSTEDEPPMFEPTPADEPRRFSRQWALTKNYGVADPVHPERGR